MLHPANQHVRLLLWQVKDRYHGTRFWWLAPARMLTKTAELQLEPSAAARQAAGHAPGGGESFLSAPSGASVPSGTTRGGSSSLPSAAPWKPLSPFAGPAAARGTGSCADAGVAGGGAGESGWVVERVELHTRHLVPRNRARAARPRPRLQLPKQASSPTARNGSSNLNLAEEDEAPSAPAARRGGGDDGQPLDAFDEEGVLQYAPAELVVQYRVLWMPAPQASGQCQRSCSSEDGEPLPPQQLLAQQQPLPEMPLDDFAGLQRAAHVYAHGGFMGACGSHMQGGEGVKTALVAGQHDCMRPACSAAPA